ncbi:MAG: beta-galactosidase, partial [Phycisphaeraceae bacterium]|nr:beta-galactosidase [Phycisphaeraceae bacterium]
MAGISYDGQSFIVDGRRIWLISGSFHYAQTSPDHWAELLDAAAGVGFNCIETAVPWHLHEPQPGTFRFEEELDLHRFIEQVAEAGLRCILRPGPYIGGGLDSGGIPAWLLREETKLRQASPKYIQAAARWIDAVMKQIKGLQITEPTGGPIVLVQIEHEWFCQNEEQAEGYLSQVARFAHESGCAVPLIHRNNLWQPIEGVIEAWSGAENLFAHSRQLRAVQNDAPGLVMGVPGAVLRVWGETEPDPISGSALLRNLAKVTAAGAMFNLEPLVGGTHFGFQSGRLADGQSRYVCTEPYGDAPLKPHQTDSPACRACRKLCVFLNQFEALVTHLRPDEHHAAAAGPLTVVQQSGSQGRLVMLWSDADSAVDDPVQITTADGQELPVYLGRDRVAWLVESANLDGAGTLDLTNLRPWAFLDKHLLVLFGPAGTDALISLDGRPIQSSVPEGAQPHVIAGEKYSVVILNEDQVEA